MIFASLATDLEDPVARLLAIRDGARRAKRRQRALAIDVEAWADLSLPLEIGALARLYLGSEPVRRRSRVCNAAVSNVPGPPIPLDLAGLRVVGLHPFGPIVDGIGLDITVIGLEDRRPRHHRRPRAARGARHARDGPGGRARRAREGDLAGDRLGLMPSGRSGCC